MKLASLKHGRDRRLVVVSRDLTRATDAFTVVPTLQAALDDWERLAPRLADLAETLEHGSVPSFRFHEHDCAAPLPRAFACLGSEGQGRGLQRWPSHGALGPRDPATAGSEDQSIGFRQGMAAITGDVPGELRLLMLVNRMALVNRSAKAPAEQADATLLLPPAAYSPVCLTVDELGASWTGSAARLSISVQVNGRAAAAIDASGVDFAALAAEASDAAAPPAGGILVALLEEAGQPPLHFGDTVRVEARDAGGHSLFGAIEQEVRPSGRG